MANKCFRLIGVTNVHNIDAVSLFFATKMLLATESSVGRETAREEAYKAIINAGFHVLAKDLARTSTTNGHWRVTVRAANELREITYMGPGDYIAPHFHDQNETLWVVAGSADCWISMNEGKTWLKKRMVEGEELFIPKFALHCIKVNHSNGLLISQRPNHQRAIIFPKVKNPMANIEI